MESNEYFDKLREFIAEEVRKEVAKQLQEERDKQNKCIICKPKVLNLNGLKKK